MFWSSKYRRKSALLRLEKLEDRLVPALTYHGGPLIGNVQIEAIYYAPWNTNSTLQTQKSTLDSFFPFITNSSYMDLLTPYSSVDTTIGHGSFSGDDSNFPTASTSPVTINGNTYNAIDETQIRSDLSAQINAGGNNLTSPNANTLYFVFTPPGVVVTSGSENSVKDFVAFHNWFHDATSDKNIVYAVMPYGDRNPNAAFFPLTVVQSLEEAATHEMAEAITDPLLNGWYDDALGVTGEIGDLSNATWGTLNGYVVQNEFSNATNASANALGTNFFISSFMNPSEGQFSGPIATFVDRSGNGNLSYAAVDWGDGTFVSVPTTVQRVNDTTFNLLASHTYNADEGTVFNPSVFLTLADGSQARGIGRLNIKDQGGGDHFYTDKGLVTLADPPVMATAVNVSARANSPFSTAVATFTDPSGAEASGNYAAMIDWGDGSGTTLGTITQSGGVFTVNGSHTYGLSGSFQTTVTITHETASQTTVHGTGSVGTVGTQIVWSGASGVDQNWSDPANWFGKIVPGPGDIAVFNSSSGGRSATVDAAFGGTISGLILDTTWGATLTMQSPLTITGASTWASGFINAGTAGLTNNGTLTVTGPNNKYLGGLFTNNGTIIHGVGPGSLGFDGDATLVNNGTYDFQADSTGIFINSGPAATFINSGTIKKSAATDTDDRSFLHVAVFNNNGGSIDVEKGRLALGQATVSSTGMTVTVAGSDAVFDLTDNTTVTYTGSYGNGVGNGHIRLINGTLAVGDTGAVFNFSPEDLFEWKGGFLSAGKAGFTNNGNLTVTGANNKFLGGLLTNNGTIIHGVGPGSLGLNGDATLVNNGTYDFRADGTGIFINSGPAATFTNNGVISKSAVTDIGDRSFLHVSVFNNNGGSIDVERGRLAFGQAAVFSSGMTITVAGSDAVFDLTDNTTVTYTGSYGNGFGTGHVRLINGTLAIGDTGAAFNFSQEGLFEWKGGVLSAGKAGLTNNGKLTVTGANNKFLGGLLTNNGTIIHSFGPGSLGFNGDANLINNGTYDFQADGTGIFINSGPAATFTNNGLIKKSSVTDTDDRSFLHVSIFNNNGGSFDVERGRLALGQAAVNSTGMVVRVAAADAVLDLTDNTTITYTGSYGNGSGSGHVRLLNGTLAVGAAGATFSFLQDGLFEWKGGFLSAGATGLTNNGELTVSGANNKFLGGLLTNNGTIIQGVGPGSLGFNGDATLVNNGIYDFQADGTGIFINSGPAATFTNNGIVKKSSATDTDDRSFLHVSVFNNNGGTIDVETGRLALGQANVNSTGINIIVAGADAVFDLTDNTTVTYSGIYGNGFGNGHVRLINGTLAVGPTGATFNFLQEGLFEWKGGFLNAGVAGLTNIGALTVTGANNKYLGGLLTNNGTIIQAVGPGGLGLGGDATLVNNGTYDFRADNTGIFINSGPAATFINPGVVKKSAGNGAASLTVSIFDNLNTGVVNVQSGMLNLSVGGTSTGNFSALPGAAINFTGSTYTVNPGTTFTGDGLLQIGGATLVINGPVSAQNVAVVNGTLKLNSNATLNVGGDYQQSGGTLAIDLAVSGFGRLNIGGTATLGSSLSIALVAPFSPSPGDQFQILTFGSHVGNFSSFSGLNLGGGLNLTPVITDTSLTLVTVISPAPPPSPGGASPQRPLRNAEENRGSPSASVCVLWGELRNDEEIKASNPPAR